MSSLASVSHSNGPTRANATDGPGRGESMPDTVFELTNRDEPRRAPLLSGPQELALQALIAGQTVTDAAQTAGVSRQTVSGWVNADPEFSAALSDARAVMRAEALLAAGAAVASALRVVRDVLDSGDASTAERLRAADIVLRLASLSGERDADTSAPRLDEQHRQIQERAREIIERRAAGSSEACAHEK